VKRTFFSHLLTACVVGCVIALDQWTKTLVVDHLGPPNSGRMVPLLGEYLTLYYIQNQDSAMGLLTRGVLLTVLIGVAVVILVALYIRLFRSMSRSSLVLFGMILGGAAGNLIDRVHYNGSVVDFLFFRLPQFGFQFYIFNLADAAISVGIGLLVVFALFARLHKTQETPAARKA
jgi:signal peptidase II